MKTISDDLTKEQRKLDEKLSDLHSIIEKEKQSIPEEIEVEVFGKKYIFSKNRYDAELEFMNREKYKPELK